MTFKLLLVHFTIFLFYSCAIQGTASGGPADKVGPKLISVFPKNETLTIPSNQKIILDFNELLDPVSIQNSIICKEDCKIKLRGRRITITPKHSWPNNEIINIKFSRKIQDYQKNIMAKPINLAYSTSNYIPDGSINGKIEKFSEKNFIEIGLFIWPLNNNSTPIQIIEADNRGFFEFRFLEYGDYTLGAIEGKFANFEKQVRRKKYAMITSDYISLTLKENKKNIHMSLSLPVEKLNISSLEMENQYSTKLLMNNQSEKKIIINPIYSPGDSVTIKLSISNRLETYFTPEFTFILPEVVDTIGPLYETSELNDNGFQIKFSEPVHINSNAIVTNKDIIHKPINFIMENSFTTILPYLADSINYIYLLGDYISDWDGNTMSDSIIAISVKQKKDAVKTIGGNIIGTVQYGGVEPIIVEAHNLKTDDIYWAHVDQENFEFENLEAGIYKLWAFESLHETNSFIYFSGIWEPYNRAARFVLYPDSIDVRARWDVEGLIINFE